MDGFILFIETVVVITILCIVMKISNWLFPIDKETLNKIREEERKKRLDLRPSGLVDEIKKIRPLKSTKRR